METENRRRRLQSDDKTKVTYVSTVPNSAGIDAVQSGVASTLGQKGYNFPALQAAGVTAPTIDTPAPTPTYGKAVLDEKKDSDNTAVIVGAAVGGVIGGLLILGIIFYMMKSKKTYKTANVVPA
jgi:hypothetical protein